MIINDQGHLVLGGVDSLDLAKEYGTPLYVMDEGVLRESCKAYKKSIEEFYDGNGLVVYASKSFLCKEACRIISEEGLGIDVVSGGELYTALSVNFPTEKIFFHGNNKTPEEIQYALENNVGCIVVDNITELNLLNSLAEQMGKTANIMFRIKPGIDAHTHSFIRTGQIDSKFGFALETGEAFEAVKEVKKMSHVKLIGLHCHIGSQIFDTEPFVAAADVMCSFMAKIKDELGLALTHLNLGGGFGIRYTENDNPVPYRNYMQLVSDSIRNICAEKGIDIPFVIIEPGRSIAGPAGTTLYTVGAVKEIPNIRTYVSIDGGMTDNPRYALYASEYEVLNAAKAGEPKEEVITLAGKCCESGDLIGKDMPIQKVKAGDCVAVLATGAYNYSMASNYNRTTKPAVVMVHNGKSRIVVKRETYEDLVRNDI